MMPRFNAMTRAWVRSCAPSFDRIFRTWALTVSQKSRVCRRRSCWHYQKPLVVEPTFAIRQCVIGVVFCHLDSDFGRDFFSPIAHAPNRVNEVLPKHALNEVSVGACFKCSVCWCVSAICGRHNDSGSGKSLRIARIASLPFAGPLTLNRQNRANEVTTGRFVDSPHAST
jgi:hypothetical protein